VILFKSILFFSSIFVLGLEFLMVPISPKTFESILFIDLLNYERKINYIIIK